MPFVNDAEPLPPFWDDAREDMDPKPRNLEFAGVNPTCTRGMGERVGMSRKYPAFFFETFKSRSTMRGPGGSIEKMGKFSAIGWLMEAVNVP